MIEMLRLTRIKKEDLELIMRWRMSPEVTKYMYTDPHLTLEIQLQWFNNIENNPECKYWIIELDEKKIGLVSLNDIDWMNSRCTWGHYIADPSYRGKGIGKLVEYNIYDYVLLELELNRLTVEVLAFNEHAIKLHKKCGSTIEGILRQEIKKGDTYHDVVIMGILRKEWLNIRKTTDYETIEIDSQRS
jgi:UDP-4-amino-4,6-dideoxy-N-acetyl-beta-L-altrosamine N-acetyltransferase